MKLYLDKDTDLAVIRRRRVAVVGFGSQGHAHALNLRDSGVRQLRVAELAGSPGARAAADAGFQVVDAAQAARWAEVLVLLVPDELQARLWHEALAPNLGDGTALMFAHGFNVRYGLIDPRPGVAVFMVAPKAPGNTVRSEYAAGRGVPCLIAVHRDPAGDARSLALSYAGAIGAGRAGILETTFAEETETDLFGEQAVLAGGLVELMKAGFDTLTEAGYSPEMAYFECVHEMKLIVDLIHARGIAGMNQVASNTAEYGEYLSGPRVVDERTRATMRTLLGEIRSGEFARRWVLENDAGQPNFRALRARTNAHPIEQVGPRIRALMPWLRGDGQSAEV